MNPSTRRSRGSLRARRIVASIIGLLALTAGDSRAQGGIGTFNGVLTGHVGAISGGDISAARATFGASMAVHEDNGWGAEVDFSHTADALAGQQVLDVTSYMVNVSWAKPEGLIRPFSLVGAGILQVNGCDSPCNIAARTYDLGFNVGAGTYIVLNDYAALRADARYFFSGADHPELNRPNNFNYWRLSFGATYKWTMAP